MVKCKDIGDWVGFHFSHLLALQLCLSALSYKMVVVVLTAQLRSDMKIKLFICNTFKNSVCSW